MKRLRVQLSAVFSPCDERLIEKVSLSSREIHLTATSAIFSGLTGKVGMLVIEADC